MSGEGSGRLGDLVVCSLEAWDDVWRRNQFLVEGLMRRNPSLRVLFVEPPHDLILGARARRLPPRPRLRRVGESGRLWALRPVKALPRLLGPGADRSLRRQLLRAARALRLDDPTLWVNDTTYAPLAAATGWPALYDVTDDWLLAPAPRRELARRERLEREILSEADEVVVCSPALARSRGAIRPVTLIPNGVDAEHFARPQPRPADLPASPVAVYVGTLHDERIDAGLVVEAAQELPELHLVLVGPDSLSADSRERLTACPNVLLLGPRPYASVPGYLQHADVLLVPHRVTPFTESLDPIKAYECLAVGTPTVATEVAGFRELGGAVTAVPRSAFAARIREALAAPGTREVRANQAIGWDARVRDFEAALLRASAGTHGRGARRRRGSRTPPPPPPG